MYNDIICIDGGFKMLGEKILVVDDEKEIRDMIVKHLTKRGMYVSYAADGEEALEMIYKNKYDLIILDIMMKKIDGFEVLKKLRENNPHQPVIFLSALDNDHDKVLGFGLGADDYMTKPFSLTELTARINARIRQSKLIPISTYSDFIDAGDLYLDLKSYTLTKKNIPIILSSLEIKLLIFFMENMGRVLTKTQIYRGVWKEDFEDDNSVMVYIRKIREKIEDDPKNPQYIQTVWGIGYKFNKND